MSSNSDNPQPSTLQSAIDTVAGAAQSAYGSLTGSAADKSAGAQTQSRASDEHAASRSAVKAGPVTATASGGAAASDPARTTGSWNQTVGAGKEMVGGVLGAEGLRQEGQRQNELGKQQEAEGQVRDLGQGVMDRAKGTLGGAVAQVAGDTGEAERRRAQREEGKARQRGVEIELQKQAEAMDRQAQK